MLAVEDEKLTCIYESLLKVNDEKYFGCKYWSAMVKTD
jgi:hypothetical protein